MAKGRTNQPLTIWVAPEFMGTPPVQSLIAQGHKVVEMDLATVDLILHPAAHQWNEFMWDYLPAALAAARKRKRGVKG